MKKLFFASVMALASISLVAPPMLRAQDSITIKDRAEFNNYQNCSTQTDPKTKATCLESFLTTYPQSVVKQAVLDSLVDTYQGLHDADNTLSAASRLLQVDPNNLKAILYSVIIKKGRCGTTLDVQTCDDAAALAHKGLIAPKPAGLSDADWKTQSGGSYPIFHSAIAWDDAIAKKDFKAAIMEYRAELMLYTDDQSKTMGLPDTLQLAQAYLQPGPSRDLVQAVWFYARVWDYAPPAYKAKIEPDLERYYKKYHGGLDGLDDLKAKAMATTFPPGTLVITPAKTPIEQIHDLIATTPDLTKLNLGDKEFILANGAKEDADKLWSVLKDQITPVPGIVIGASDSVIKVAVTDDAKTAKTADFIVNLAKPLTEKEIPAVGLEFKTPPATTLIGTYDSFTLVPATETTVQTAQIVLRAGEIQLEKKKPAAPPAHKPAAGHKPAAK
jgi:hypothetical protein